VTRPKVAVSCRLPQAFEEGDCEIYFNRTLSPGMYFKLTHEDILTNMLSGLNTDHCLNLRKFLGCREGNDSEFIVTLGNATFSIDADEAQDLCYCVDKVFGEYKSLIESAEDILQTWSYTRVFRSDLMGFHLITVPKALWELMQSFSNEFDYDEGKSEWHIFQRANFGICVYPRSVINVDLYPYPQIFQFLDNGFVEVIYKPYIRMNFTNPENWRDNVGPHGIWTATYTANWLIEKFIPKVIDHYKEQIDIQNFSSQSFRLGFMKFIKPKMYSARKSAEIRNILYKSIEHEINNFQIPLSKIELPVEFESYIHDISNFRSSFRITSDLTVPYYSSFLDLAKNANPSSLSENPEIGRG
jgi:hypothetical protein